METALIAAIGQAASAQFEYLSTVVTTGADLFKTGYLIPQAIKQQAYIDRLKKALEFTDPYAGLYDEQLKMQRILMYGFLGLFALIIIAAIIKK